MFRTRRLIVSRHHHVSGARSLRGPVAARRVDAEPVPTVGAALHHYVVLAARLRPGMRFRAPS